MLWRLAPALMLLAIVVGALAYARVQSDKADAAEARAALLEQNLAGSEAARRELAKQAEITEKAYAERFREHRAADTRRRDHSAQLDRVIRADPAPRAWADEPIPAAVADLLRHATGAASPADRENPDPGGPDGTPPRTAIHREHEPPPSRMGIRGRRYPLPSERGPRRSASAL